VFSYGVFFDVELFGSNYMDSLVIDQMLNQGDLQAMLVLLGQVI
jgi:hypothetical protein